MSSEASGASTAGGSRSGSEIAVARGADSDRSAAGLVVRPDQQRELRVRDSPTARRMAATVAVLIVASVAVSMVLTIRFLEDCTSASEACSGPSESTRWALLAGYVGVAVVAAGIALYLGRFARVERIWRRARGVALAYAVGSIGWSIVAIVVTR